MAHSQGRKVLEERNTTEEHTSSEAKVTAENGGLIGRMDERLEAVVCVDSDTLQCCAELTSHQAIAGRYRSPLSLSAPSKAQSRRCIVGSVATGDQQCCSTIWTVTLREEAWCWKDGERERVECEKDRAKEAADRVSMILQLDIFITSMWDNEGWKQCVHILSLSSTLAVR